MSKQDKPFGALSPGYWEALSEEERAIAFYRSDPRAAYRRIRELEELNKAISDSANALASAAMGMVGAREKQKLATRAKRLKTLNQQAATKENQRKSDQFKHDLQQYVNGRIKKDSGTAPKEITNDVLASSWVRRDRNGNPYSYDYLYPKVSKMVTAARAALKRGGL